MSRQLTLFPSFDSPDDGTPAPQATMTATSYAAAPDRLRGPRDSQQLTLRLTAWLDDPLESLVLTDNRRRIISARPSADGLAVRIHRCFLTADEATLRAVAEFLNSGKGETRRTIALQVIRQYFDRHRPETTATQGRILQPIGRHFDLRQLRDRLNGRYFGGLIDVDITWGRAPKVRRRRGRGFSILLGSYTETDRLVRIHPCLDQQHVPEYVVESVVYHEMLHAALPVERHNGRRRLHTPEFKRRERLYEHFDLANRWLEANLSKLAASR